jgi:SulP family sulfate permease
VYSVHGALFSASSNDLVHRFDHTGDPQSVVVDLSDAHVWDASTVAVLDASPPGTRAVGRPSRSSA